MNYNEKSVRGRGEITSVANEARLLLDAAVADARNQLAGSADLPIALQTPIAKLCNSSDKYLYNGVTWCEGGTQVQVRAHLQYSPLAQATYWSRATAVAVAAEIELLCANRGAANFRELCAA